VQEDSALGVGHDAAAAKLAEAVARIGGVGAVTAVPALYKSHGLVDGVEATYPEVAPEETLDPGALVSLVGNERDAYLRDGDGKGVVREAGAVASLHATVEEEASMHPLEISKVDLVAACLGRGTRSAKDVREKLLAYALAYATFLLDRAADLLLEAFVHCGEVFARVPGVEVERRIERLAESSFELVPLHGEDLLGIGKRRLVVFSWYVRHVRYSRIHRLSLFSSADYATIIAL
jgi:hypothetical protein